MDNERSLLWREMTSEEQDQFDPEGPSTFCETQTWMEGAFVPVRVAIDESSICLEYSLPQYGPEDPDALLAIREHSMLLDDAKLWVEQYLPVMKTSKELVDMKFRTEVI